MSDQHITDIVDRLRCGRWLGGERDALEAAAEIRRLRAEIQRLVKSRNRWGQKYNKTLEKLKAAVWSDSEECKMLTDELRTARNDALEEAAAMIDAKFSFGVGRYYSAAIRDMMPKEDV